MRIRLNSAAAVLMALFLAACFGTQSPAPVTRYGQQAGGGSSGVHSVIPGDTLWSIAQRYNIVMQDIVHVNKLRAPFILRTGQRLDLPPPRTYRVRDGDTLYTVSRLFDTSTSEIARLNRLQPPYIIRAGQSLTLPGAGRRDYSSDYAKAVHSPMPPAGKKPGTVPAAKKAKASSSPPARPSAKKPRRASPPSKRSSGSFARPVPGRIISGYGPKKNGLHNDGINIAAPRGTPVKVADKGEVVYAGNALKGSGNLVLVRHDGGWMTAYAHMDKMKVRRGQTVTRGTQIGTVGTTGSVSTPQLHFEVRKGTHAVNPALYIYG